MALIRFLVICLVTIHISCSVAEDGDNIDTEPRPRFFFNKLCSEDNFINPSNSKIVCLLCTKFDRSCFDSSTTSDTSTSESPTDMTTTTTPKCTASDISADTWDS